MGRLPSPYNKEQCSRKVTKWHPWWHLKFKKRCCCLCMVTSHLIWTCIRVNCLSKAICKKCLKLAELSRYLATLIYRRLKTQYKSKFWSKGIWVFLIEKNTLIWYAKLYVFYFGRPSVKVKIQVQCENLKRKPFFFFGGGVEEGIAYFLVFSLNCQYPL